MVEHTPSRRRISPSMVVALAALVMSTAGAGTAATVLITGKQVKDGSLTGRDVKDSSITGRDVKDRSLSPKDFNGSIVGPQGLQGPQGPQGVQGLQGPAGPPGSPDTTQFYNKVESDGRFLGKTAQAADSAKIAGLGLDGLLRFERATLTTTPSATTTPFLTIPNTGVVLARCNNGGGPTSITPEINLLNQSGGTLDVFVSRSPNSTTPVARVNIPNNSTVLLAQTGSSREDFLTLHINERPTAAPSFRASALVTIGTDATSIAPSSCDFVGQAAFAARTE